MHYRLPTTAIFCDGVTQSLRSLPRLETTLCWVWEYLLQTGVKRVNHHDCTEVQLLDLRPWLNDPTHVLLVTRVSWTGFAPLVPGSSSLSLLPCVDGASAGVGGKNGRAGAS
eukprot:scaffold2877_cov377-Pavlova_lutheri.AAC.9